MTERHQKVLRKRQTHMWDIITYNLYKEGLMKNKYHVVGHLFYFDMLWFVSMTATLPWLLFTKKDFNLSGTSWLKN